jgi:hypothetical protein
MKRSTLLGWISAISICLVILTNFGWRTHQRANASAVRSCLHSCLLTIQNQPKIVPSSISISAEWHLLDEASSRVLFSSLVAAGTLDCSSMAMESEQRLVDPWGSAISARVRMLNDKIEWQLVSPANDRRLGTGDDIIVDSSGRLK